MSEPKYSFVPSKEGNNFRIATFSPEKEVSLWVDGQIKSMEKTMEGFWETEISLEFTSSLYGFMVNGEGPYPDPGGRFMPDGIGGLSQLIGMDSYGWINNNWTGLPVEEYIIEEVHVGTYTEPGTYSGMEQHLEHLSNLGVTAVEIMPVAQFYGSRNWGYDGVYLYSPHFGYGTPDQLKHLVDAIHGRGMCAVLDVVYNHTGPVGNYLDKYAQYHNTGYSTPWGNCFNLDGPGSDGIREYILQNAIFWLSEFRFDALRLDAVHGIVDHSPLHILKEMALRVESLERETGRIINLIAESDSNDRMLAKEISKCGTGMDAQWNDDFHHVVHTALTGEKEGYYMDYGAEDEISSIMNSGFLYQGQYSGYLKRRRGTVWDNPKSNLIVCSQNHDQIGNRAQGERLISIAGEGKARLAALLTIMSPFTPLLFMGEETGERSPFLFFMQTEDSDFARAVYQGRKDEFKRFRWNDTPDPSSFGTFLESKIKWDRLNGKDAGDFLNLYSRLISLRKSYVLPRRNEFSCRMGKNRVLEIMYGKGLLMLASFNENSVVMKAPGYDWNLVLQTSNGANILQKTADTGTFVLEPFSGAIFTGREA